MPNINSASQTELTVAIHGSRSRVDLISGANLPTKIVIAGTDVTNATLIDIQNRERDGAAPFYDTVQPLQLGPVALAERHLQGADQTFSARGGVTRGTGQLKVALEHDGWLRQRRRYVDETAAWLVCTGQGKFLMVTPFLMDSFEVRDFLAEAISGTFTIQMISAGSMHGAEQLAVAGWTTQVGPTETH